MSVRKWEKLVNDINEHFVSGHSMSGPCPEILAVRTCRDTEPGHHVRALSMRVTRVHPLRLDEAHMGLTWQLRDHPTLRS